MNVRIYKPAKSSMQSGRAKDNSSWILEGRSDASRDAEPLMGWVSSTDTLNQIKLAFSSSEDAVAYAEKKGWDYSVADAQMRQIKPRNYTDNFKYIPYEG